MTDKPTAWVWSQYRAVVSDDEAAADPLPLFGGASGQSGGRTRRGAVLAAAMIVGLFFPKIAFLLLITAVLMVLSGLEPQRFEDFMQTMPGGGVILKILAMADTLL